MPHIENLAKKMHDAYLRDLLAGDPCFTEWETCHYNERSAWMTAARVAVIALRDEEDFELGATIKESLTVGCATSQPEGGAA